MNHDQLQSECWKIAWNEYPETRRCMFATLNQTKPYPQESKYQHMRRITYFKSIGLLPGAWDHILYWNRVQVIFDYKVGSDKLSDEQIKFAQRCIENGGEVHEIRTVERFREILRLMFKH